MIKNLIQWLLVGTVALASNPDPSNKFKFGDGQLSNKVLEFNRGINNPSIRWNESGQQLEFSNDGTNFNGVGSGSGSGSGFNALTNPDFESGISLGWTNLGGAFLSVSSGTNLLFGKKSATFQSFGSGNRVDSSVYLVPEGLAGGNCAAGMWYKGGDTNLILQALDGSSNVLNSRTLTASVVATPFYLTFPCPVSGGSFSLRLTSTTSSALVAIDRMFLGESSMIAVGQATLVGAARIPSTAATYWSVTSSTLVSPGTVTNGTVPARTIITNPGPGVIQTTAAQTATFTVNGMPPGNYAVFMRVNLNASELAANTLAAAINDGTTTSMEIHEGCSSATCNHNFQLEGMFSYSSSGNHTYEFYVAEIETGNVINGPDLRVYPMEFEIYRFPTVQEMAFRPDQFANSWSGAHQGTSCVWSTTTTGSLVDPAFNTACTLIERTNVNFGTVTSYNNGTPGNNLPGIVFTPSRAGTYYVCGDPTLQSSTDVQYVLQLSGNGTEISRPITGDQAATVSRNPVCGLYKATSTAPVTIKLKLQINNGTGEFATNGETGDAVTWTIFQIDQALPAPVLVNSVVTQLNGITNTIWAVIAEGTTCSSDPCTITRQSGGISVVNRVGSGDYIFHFDPGVFSAAPSCITITGTSEQNTATTNTSTTWEVATRNSSGTTVDTGGINIICMGPK